MSNENNKREPRNRNSKLGAYLTDQGSGYSRKVLDDVDLIYYDIKIYVLQTMCRHVLDCYHLYLNNTGGNRLVNTIREVCSWKGLVIRADFYAKPWKICQQFKSRQTLHGHLPLKSIAEQKPWDHLHVYLICSYIRSIRQHQPGGEIIKKDVSLTCKTMIVPDIGYFEIFKITTFNINEVMRGKDEYIDSSSARVSHIFNNKWLSRYPHPQKFMFDKLFEFKWDFTPLLKYFGIKPISLTIKKHNLMLQWSGYIK